MAKHAREFVYTTLKSDKHDVYALCATAWILYHLARESRDRDPKAVEERRRNFQRAADLYDKALQLDPACAVAAQGLAIIIAEDTLGSFGTAAGAAAAAGQATPEEHQKRANIAREALDIFGKVRESINDGSVYVNMGHCYYARDEFARAIESVSECSTYLDCWC
jgi:RNA polymerase-associated protein CTR9